MKDALNDIQPSSSSSQSKSQHRVKRATADLSRTNGTAVSTSGIFSHNKTDVIETSTPNSSNLGGHHGIDYKGINSLNSIKLA
jgi:hypothetical protein